MTTAQATCTANFPELIQTKPTARLTKPARFYTVSEMLDFLSDAANVSSMTEYDLQRGARFGEMCNAQRGRMEP